VTNHKDKNCGLSLFFVIRLITGINPETSFGNFIARSLRGIISMLMQDNSTNKLQFASLLKFESHYPPLRGIVQLANPVVLRTRYWSFTINRLKTEGRRNRFHEK
jgi:hypothetical protein